MEHAKPSIIDLDAEAAKLTMFRGLTPQTKRAERKGSATQLAGTGHWETHPEDELVHVLDGTARLDILQEDGPRSYALSAGMIAIVRPGVWHRFHSAAGKTTMSAVVPGEHIDLDVDDPRTGAPGLDIGNAMAPPSIVDLNAELAKLVMFRRTPQSTLAERKGSGTRLASYRDGALFAIKFSGKDHWEVHPTGDELIVILDGMAALEIAGEGPPRSFALRAGMAAIVPQGAWHRLQSSESATQLTVTPFPSEHVEVDVDDPRTLEQEPT